MQIGLCLLDQGMQPLPQRKRLNQDNLKSTQTQTYSAAATVSSTEINFRFLNPLENFTFQSWKTFINIELGGAFLLAKNFGKSLATQKSGSFVFVSSIYGIVGNDHSIYQGSNLANVYSNKKESGNEDNKYEECLSCQ